MKNKSARSQAHEFDTIALLLQGGGALGAYQGGVYEALAEENIEPSWVCGVSIGAVNGAIIAGNKPADRVSKVIDYTPENFTINVKSIANLDVDQEAPYFAIYTATKLPQTCANSEP